MRIVLVLVLWIAILGGVAVFLGRPGNGPQLGEQSTEAVDMAFSLELTSTFDSAGDVFGEDEGRNGGVSIQNGKYIVTGVGPLEAGIPMQIQDLGPMHVGDNEIYVSVRPVADSGVVVHALRLRVWQGHGILAETTLWDDGGENVDGIIRFRVPDQGRREKGVEHDA
ncbi:hypothetical protein [Desulfovibrio inopinatus]|uniref:hypothetical protein n=1 Tax=Desulfovibrio inopinatus TaxID=102109 RepID=UPI0004032D24|nr:hypothetical protein [Desulfovibrio inopinatus]